MPRPMGRELTHGTFDEEALGGLLEDQGARLAVSACLSLIGAAFLERPGGQSAAIPAVRRAVADGWPLGDPDRLEPAAALLVGSRDADGGQAERGQAPIPAEDGSAPTPAEDEQALLDDWMALFRGPRHLRAAPWGSVYMDHDQVLYGWTWEGLRAWMRESGIAGTYRENDPEDNFGRLMSLAGQLASERRPDLLGQLLADHLLPWAPRFLETVRAQAATDTCRGLAMLAAASLEDVRGLGGVSPAVRRLYR